MEVLVYLARILLPLLVHMFYVNMHTISLGRSFWMAMFGQSFHITFLSIRCVLSLRIFLWILATFLTYSFYPLSHRTEIHQLTACFIHTILFGQQFNIGQVIIDIITLYQDFSFRRGALPFRLLISKLLDILALRLLLHRMSRLLMPCCMRALRPNTIVIRMVP